MFVVVDRACLARVRRGLAGGAANSAINGAINGAINVQTGPVFGL